MPVILTREEELETWMAAPWPEAARLQRPLPDGPLRIVARGERKDEAVQLDRACCADQPSPPQRGDRPITFGVSRPPNGPALALC
jgi:putative SOS response-associated peptidase YedK